MALSVSLASVVTMAKLSIVDGPSLSRPCQRSHRPAKAKVAPRDQKGLFGLALALPFVESVGRHQAAALLERGAERRLFRHRFAACVDQAGADGHVLGPGWNQSPAQHRELAPAGGVESHDGGRLSRRDIVARREIRPLVHAEQAPQRLDRRDQLKPSAHTAAFPSKATAGKAMADDRTRLGLPYVQECSSIVLQIGTN